MPNRNVVVATRTNAKGFDDCIESLKKLASCNKIRHFYIVCDDAKKSSDPLGKNQIPVTTLYNSWPSSPTAVNTVIDTLKNVPKYLLIFSKEVDIKKEHLETMLTELESNDCILVVGYKLTINSKPDLNKELEQYYNNDEHIAYVVPWNTCAMWNYGLFISNVERFDEITARSPFGNICISINGECFKTKHQGMEDGLAISKASSNSSEIKYRLLDQRLPWKVDDSQNHREKLARKDTVMRDFMALREYSEKALRKAKL